MLKNEMDVNQQLAKPINVYLAGKVQGNKWSLVKDLPDHIARIESSDGTNHSEHLWGTAAFQLGVEIHQEFVQDFTIKPIIDSDILIAYLDDPTSYGSIAEIAFASAHGKSCHVISNWKVNNKFSDELDCDDPFYDAYWFVCAFPLVTVKHVESEKEARSYAWSTIYKEYHRRAIKSDHWKNLRMEAIHKAKHRCQLCNAKGRMHVHHRTYANIGSESIDDVIVLCGNCHEKFHDAGKE